MRSATSYFNGTLYRKTLARFWPLWGGYGVLWLFVLPLNLLNNFLHTARNLKPAAAVTWNVGRAQELPGVLGFGLFLAVFFAVLSAMAVFGYLYNSRSACWTHALPMRREALFVTQYLAGLSFLLLPLLAAGVLTAVVEVSFLPASNWGQALGILLTALLAQSGLCVFFFSFAAFCAMFTGHILALPAFYGILNGLAAGIYYLIQGLMQEFFYGYTWNETAYEVVRYLTPVAALENACRWYGGGVKTSPRMDSPGLIAVYAAVGVALSLAALYVYSWRHVETAGDVVAVPLVRPLFKYGVSFCAGLAFGVATSVFFGWGNLALLIPCILVWAVVGYFVAEMLLKKSFRVFKAWKGAVATAAVLLVVCLVCFLDLFGVVKRVPDPAQVASVEVELNLSFPYDSGHYLDTTLTDPEQIQKICDLHRAVVADPDRNDQGGEGYFSLELTYTLKDGGRLDRRYYSVMVREEDLALEGSASQVYQTILEDRELLAMAYGFDEFLKNGRLSGVYLRGAHAPIYLDGYERRLWDAVQADFAEGTIGARYVHEYGQDFRENTYSVNLVFQLTSIRDDSTTRYEDGTYETGLTVNNTLTITLTPQARHTLAVLDETGVRKEGWSLSGNTGADNPEYPDTVSQ